MEISSGIHRVDGIRGVNAYLYLPEGGPVVVIDTGLAGNAERIVGQVEALGRKPSDVELILLTHPDVDHSGSAARLKRLTGARVAIHAADAPGLAGDKSYERSSGVWGMLFRSLMRFFTVEPVQPDVILKDGDRIGGLEVLHCPGHTAGSVCFYAPGVAIFIGDALGTDGKGNPQLPPRARCWNARLAGESVKRVAALEFDVLLPGHGEPIAGGASERTGSWLRAARTG